MPVYSNDGVHVVFPPGTSHFRRVVECAQCRLGVVDHRAPFADAPTSSERPRSHAEGGLDTPSGRPGPTPRRVTTGERWLSVPEAANYLGMDLRTVHRLIGRREIHATGWPMQIPQSELEDFLRRSRIKPGSLQHLYPPGGSR
jgi:excisionase family DNA binding protein